MYFLIWWKTLFEVAKKIGCSHLIIRFCISSNSRSSLNNLTQLCKKCFTSPVGSLSSLGLIFNGCWSSPAKGSLRNGVFAIPFPLALVFEQEAPASQKSLQDYKKVYFSFCNLKVVLTGEKIPRNKGGHCPFRKSQLDSRTFGMVGLTGLWTRYHLGGDLNRLSSTKKKSTSWVYPTLFS